MLLVYIQLLTFFFSIGATILSHHVDDFTLVAAFFLFSLGCVNILLGLIFGAAARSKRSITEWRSDHKGVLPSVTNKRSIFLRPGDAFTFNNNNEKGPSEFGVGPWNSSTTSWGSGFGRRGEKAAGLKGRLSSNLRDFCDQR
jgi:hypothetical protein